MKLLATIASIALITSSVQAQEVNTMRRSNSILSGEDVRLVAPQLDKYTQDRLLGDVWKRPGTAASSQSPR